jgi:Ser/Thr protein kinase RdoA (MazF antagonist)
MCLEELGCAHGDINPQNVIIDGNNELELIDADHSLDLSADLDVGCEPCVQQHRESMGGLFGVAGPRQSRLL